MANKPLQAGDLDRLGDLLQYDEHRDTMGAVAGRSLSPVATGIYCQKREKGGKEIEGDDRLTAFGTVEFTIRYRPGITEKMAFRCEGITYDIKNVREGEGRRQWLILTCQKND